MRLNAISFVADVFGTVKLADAMKTLVPGDWFQVARSGVFFSPQYGRLEISGDDLATMYRNFKTKTPLAPTQLPVDYEHGSDSPQQPEEGKAAGWVQDLQLRDSGQTLWAKVNWTRRAAELIAAGEYRFVSPFFLTDYLDKVSGKKIGPTLKAIAITNRPFLEGMQPIPAPSIAASETVTTIVRERMNTNRDGAGLSWSDRMFHKRRLREQIKHQDDNIKRTLAQERSLADTDADVETLREIPCSNSNCGQPLTKEMVHDTSLVKCAACGLEHQLDPKQAAFLQGSDGDVEALDDSGLGDASSLEGDDLPTVLCDACDTTFRLHDLTTLPIRCRCGAMWSTRNVSFSASARRRFQAMVDKAQKHSGGSPVF